MQGSIPGGEQATTLTINTTYIYLMLILPCTSNTCLLWITLEIFDLVTLEHEAPISAYVTLGLKRGPGKKNRKKIGKIGFSHFVTATRAAFQLETYRGVSLNNQTTGVNCRESSKHLILRASLAKRQQRGRGRKKYMKKWGKKNRRGVECKWTL